MCKTYHIQITVGIKADKLNKHAHGVTVLGGMHFGQVLGALDGTVRRHGLGGLLGAERLPILAVHNKGGDGAGELGAALAAKDVGAFAAAVGLDSMQHFAVLHKGERHVAAIAADLDVASAILHELAHHTSLKGQVLAALGQARWGGTSVS